MNELIQKMAKLRSAANQEKKSKTKEVCLLLLYLQAKKIFYLSVRLPAQDFHEVMVDKRTYKHSQNIFSIPVEYFISWINSFEYQSSPLLSNTRTQIIRFHQGKLLFVLLRPFLDIEFSSHRVQFKQ